MNFDFNNIFNYLDGEAFGLDKDEFDAVTALFSGENINDTYLPEKPTRKHCCKKRTANVYRR